MKRRRHLFKEVDGEAVLLHLRPDLRLGGRLRLDAGDVGQAVRQQLEQFGGFICLLGGSDDSHSDYQG